ncbi:MAG: SGNH/GDSL hydrolase family protein [Enhygromyxa sp.]
MLTRNQLLVTSLCLSSALVLAACGDDDIGAGDGNASETGETGESGDDEIGDEANDDLPGDGDGDDPGDGDGDSGDGDGDSGDGDGDDSGDGDGDGDERPMPSCIDEQFVSGDAPGPGYGGTGIEIGSHCQGTNHQDIQNIERVVFVGDSVTVGTPPTGAGDFYRSILADELSFMFDLDAPSFLWEQANPLDGKAAVKESGDFASCAEWGARTDDFLRGGGQIPDCFATQDLQKTTLVITTMGGNDIAAIAKDAIEGVSEEALWEDVEEMLDYMREAVHWLREPGRFPNGVFVVFANVYEFTDATADLLSCPAAGVAGFDKNPDDPEQLIEMMTYINSEFAKLAAETETDMVFMFEGFCGHGFHADNPNTQCYRGPGNATWFDLTCIHPTADGHKALAQMFLETIDE